MIFDGFFLWTSPAPPPGANTGLGFLDMWFTWGDSAAAPPAAVPAQRMLTGLGL